MNAREFCVGQLWKTQLTRFNIVLCWFGEGLHVVNYFNEELYEKLLPITLDIKAAWGWSMFFSNSLMTGGIIYKIM